MLTQTPFGIYRSPDYGVTGPSWVKVANAAELASAFAVIDSTIFAATYWGISKTTNNGDSWISANRGLTDSNCFSLIADGTTLLAGTEGGLFRSTDLGLTWTARNTGMSKNTVYAIVRNGPCLFVSSRIGNLATVFRSTNEGISWDTVNTGLPRLTTKISSLAAIGQSVFAGCDSGVFRITNNGSSWSDVGMNEESVTVLYVVGSNLFGGSKYHDHINGTVFLSTDNGMTWQKNGPQSNNYALSIYGSYLYSGGDEGIWAAELSRLLPTNSVGPTSARSAALTSFPNPCTNTLAVVANALSKVEIIDALGKVRQTQNVANINGENLQGKYSLDVSALSSGAYYLKVYDGETVSIIRFLKN